jgi:hypothetical protein
MSDAHEPTVEDLNAELAKSKREMEAKLEAIQERLLVAQRAEEEKARKAEEARQKAEAEAKAEVERLAKEAQDKAEAEEKAKADEKARAVREATEKREEEAAGKAERVRLANQKRLDRELTEFKERMEAEAKKKAEDEEKAKAEKGMKLATPDDVSALERARQINAENARIREGNLKPKAGSSKAAATPAQTPKPKTPGNLARQVREEDRVMKTGKRGKQGDVAVSGFLLLHSAFLTCIP